MSLSPLTGCFSKTLYRDPGGARPREGRFRPGEAVLAGSLLLGGWRGGLTSFFLVGGLVTLTSLCGIIEGTKVPGTRPQRRRTAIGSCAFGGIAGLVAFLGRRSRPASLVAGALAAFLLGHGAGIVISGDEGEPPVPARPVDRNGNLPSRGLDAGVVRRVRAALLEAGERRREAGAMEIQEAWEGGSVAGMPLTGMRDFLEQIKVPYREGDSRLDDDYESFSIAINAYGISKLASGPGSAIRRLTFLSFDYDPEGSLEAVRFVVSLDRAGIQTPVDIICRRGQDCAIGEGELPPEEKTPEVEQLIAEIARQALNLKSE